MSVQTLKYIALYMLKGRNLSAHRDHFVRRLSVCPVVTLYNTIQYFIKTRQHKAWHPLAGAAGGQS